MPFGVALVHPQQVAGEQRRLLAALARLDLDDRVAVVVGVLGDEQLPQPLLNFFALLDELLGLFAEGGVLVRKFPGGLLVVAGLLPLAVRVDDRGELGIALGERPGLIRVRVHAGIGEGTLKLGMLASQIP